MYLKDIVRLKRNMYHNVISSDKRGEQGIVVMYTLMSNKGVKSYSFPPISKACIKSLTGKSDGVASMHGIYYIAHDLLVSM